MQITLYLCIYNIPIMTIFARATIIICLFRSFFRSLSEHELKTGERRSKYHTYSAVDFGSGNRKNTRCPTQPPEHPSKTSPPRTPLVAQSTLMRINHVQYLCKVVVAAPNVIARAFIILYVYARVRPG